MSQTISIVNFFVAVCAVGAFLLIATSPKPPPKDPQFLARIESSDVALVKFGANWCPPCREIEGELDHLANSSPDVAVIKLDVARDSELAAHFGVRTIPHLILFKHGKQVDQLVGYRTHDELKAWIGTTKSIRSQPQEAGQAHISQSSKISTSTE